MLEGLAEWGGLWGIMGFPPLLKISHQVEFNSDMNEHIITTYSGAHAAAAREAINPDRWNNFVSG